LTEKCNLVGYGALDVPQIILFLSKRISLCGLSKAPAPTTFHQKEMAMPSLFIE